MTTESTASLKDEYLKRVEDLWEIIGGWLSQLDPTARVDTEEVTIREEPVGEYTAQSLVIKRKDYKDVRLIPRGLSIIGAEGRVDMKSDLGTETLVYVREGGPQVSFRCLTESGELLMKDERPLGKDVAEGWVYVQNRQLGLLPTLDADLFYRLLEVLG